jgi:hypothetical protein
MDQPRNGEFNVRQLLSGASSAERCPNINCLTERATSTAATHPQGRDKRVD